MTLQVSQYTSILGGEVQVPFGPPVAVDNLANAATLTIGGSAGKPRIVRILAKGSDHNITWATDVDGETFKDGVPEFRVLASGTVITVAAAS